MILPCFELKMINIFIMSNQSLFQKADSNWYDDANLALVRLNVPIAGTHAWLSFLRPPFFNSKTIMPICIPHSKGFNETHQDAFTMERLSILGRSGNNHLTKR